MYFLFGQVVGGLIAVFLLSRLIEWAIVKRVANDPVAGKLISLVAAWFVASTIYGFGSADGGDFVLRGYLIYGFAALILAPLAYSAGVRAREDAEM